MKMAMVRKFFVFLLVVALCTAMTQPILAYMGGQLPELPENYGEETDYATSGVCVVSGGEDKTSVIVMALASELENESAGGETLRLVYSGAGWSCGNWSQPDLVCEDLYGLIIQVSGEVGGLDGFNTVVVDARTEMYAPDWRPILDLGELMHGIKSLTVNGLECVEENAFSYPETWVEALSLPDAESIGVSAFENCDSLASVSLPKAVSIGSYAFLGCGGLKEIYFGDISVIELVGKNAVPGYTPDDPLIVCYTDGNWDTFTLNNPNFLKYALYVYPVKLGDDGESSSESESSSSSPSESESSSSSSSESESSSSGSSESESSSSSPSESESSSSSSSESGSSSSSPSEPESSSSSPSEPESSSSGSSESESSSSSPSESGSSSSGSSESESSSSSSSEPDDPSSNSSEPESSSSAAPPLKTSSESSADKTERPVQSGLAAVNAEEISQAVQLIADTAAADGGDTIKKPIALRFQNKSYISLAHLREITRASREAEVKITVQADTKIGNTVVNRLYIDPAKATRGIRLMTGQDAVSVLRRFELYTENTLAVLSLDQPESFGMKVGVAFKLPLPAGVDEKNLTIYKFNPETGKYKRIFVPHKRLEPGYLWLETDQAGFIVIGNGTIKTKR